MRSTMSPRSLLGTLLIGFAALGCVTERTYAPAGAGTARAVRTRPNAVWQVETEGGRSIGYVVRFEDPFDPDARHFSVRDADHCELGTLDAIGRAWRYEPHEREATYLGGGSVAESAARILGAEHVLLQRISLERASRTPSEGSAATVVGR